MNIWNTSPLFIALFLFCIDFLAILLIRIVLERKFYLREWWTYKYGDSIFLPMYGFFAATILQTSHSTVIQTYFWWNITLVALGIVLLFGTEYHHVKYKIYTLKQEFLPSQLYHSIIFVVMFYIVGSSLQRVIVIHKPVWSFIGVLIALGGYLLTVIKDYGIEKSFKKRKR